MATTTQIQAVRELLGPSAAANGWDDVRIAQDLDGPPPKTPNQIALSWWRFRAASTANFVSVSEAGSSRSLGDIFRNASQQASAFEKLVQLELQGDPENKPRGWFPQSIGRA